MHLQEHISKNHEESEESRGYTTVEKPNQLSPSKSGNHEIAE